MKRQMWLTGLSLVLAVASVSPIVLVPHPAKAIAAANAAVTTPAAREVELFAGMRDGDLDVKIIAKSDRAGRVIIANKTGVPVHVKLPEAFAAVPVLAQFGGGGFGGGGGGGQGGGGGGLFSIPSEETAKINVALICLDHGLKNPSSSKPYALVPAASHVDKPAVIELLKAFGRGELDHGAAQAAAWNLNSGMSWQALAAKQTGTVRNTSRSPYFSANQIRTAMAYVQAAESRALSAAHDEDTVPEAAASDESVADEKLSEERSTTDTAE